MPEQTIDLKKRRFLTQATSVVALKASEAGQILRGARGKNCFGTAGPPGGGIGRAEQ